MDSSYGNKNIYIYIFFRFFVFKIKNIEHIYYEVI